MARCEYVCGSIVLSGQRIQCDIKTLRRTAPTTGDHELATPEPEDDPALESPHDEDPKEDAGKEEDYNSRIYMSYLKIHRDQEPWYRGDPEVFLLAGKICAGKSYGYYFDLKRVNDTGKWYWIKDLNSMWFTQDCSYETFYSVWERDGSVTGTGSYYGDCCRYVQVRLSCYPYTACSTQYVHSLRRNKGDDPIYDWQPKTITSKMRGSWGVHNYDSQWSDSRTASGKFYKTH